MHLNELPFPYKETSYSSPSNTSSPSKTSLLNGKRHLSSTKYIFSFLFQSPLTYTITLDNLLVSNFSTRRLAVRLDIRLYIHLECTSRTTSEPLWKYHLHNWPKKLLQGICPYARLSCGESKPCCILISFMQFPFERVDVISDILINKSYQHGWIMHGSPWRWLFLSRHNECKRRNKILLSTCRQKYQISNNNWEDKWIK